MLAAIEFTDAIILFVTLIVSLTFHEAAHAWVAYLGGDRTAYYSGQVTLNPIPHIQREPIGMVVLPILMLATTGGIIGFASAPVNPHWAERHPRRAAVMAAAGPLANLLLAAVAFMVLMLIGSPQDNSAEAGVRIAFAFLALNLLLFLFNLLPLPPLDGATVVHGLVRPMRPFYDWMNSFPYSTIITLVVAWRVVPLMQEPVMGVVIDWLRALR